GRYCRSRLWRGRELAEPGRLILGDQRIDQFVERLAGQHAVDLVQGEVDAVVGDPALREIVGADALGAVARADLALAAGGARLVLALALGVVEPRAQDLQRLRLVLVL